MKILLDNRRLGGIDSVQAGTNVIIDNSDPANPIVNATFSQEGKYLISGGAAWSGTGLTYDVTSLTYFFNGNKISLATQVTLAVADPTNNRLDAIVVDEAGVVSVIQGTASVNPITPPIPEEQLLVQYILVEAGLASPSVSNENIYLDDPAGSWTLSTYTTGAPTGTLIFNGTTSPKEGINHIQANADQRLGARFVRATSFDAFQYTVLQVWVRFTGTNVDSNKSLNVRFENSVGTLVGNTLNLFNYGIQRNVLNTWQLAVIPITAFGSLPTTVKGFRAIMIGGTVGVTRQWDMDWIHLSDTSVPNVEVPKINFYKDDVAVASQSGLNLKAGSNIGITAVEDALNNRVDYIITSLGGGGSSFETKTKAEIDALITTNALVPGTLYKITGVHDSTATLGALEDDGVINGITIYLRALTTNTLEKGGIGVFHSPIRDMSHWNSKVFQTWIKLDGSGSTLRPDEAITADNGATGILKIGTDTYHSFVLIEPLTGDWTTAASFVGDTSAGSFTITSYTLPLGSTIGDKVLWGNYVWTNTTGTVGLPIDERTLDSNWTKVAYNNTDYVTMYNYCEFDPTQNWITRRVDDKGNDVKFLFPIGSPFSGIAVFEWNNGVDFMNEYEGCFMNDLEFSYVVNCNMWKHTFKMNKLTSSQVRDNLGNKISISNNNIDMASVIHNNGNTINILYNNGVEFEVDSNKVSTMSVSHNIIVNSGILNNIGNYYFLQDTEGNNVTVNDNTGGGIGITNNKGNSVSVEGNVGDNIFINNNTGNLYEIKNNNGQNYNIDNNVGNGYNLNNNSGNDYYLYSNSGSNYNLNNNTGNTYSLNDNSGNNYNLTNDSGNEYYLNNNSGNDYNLYNNTGNIYYLNYNTGNTYYTRENIGSDYNLSYNSGNNYSLNYNSGDSIYVTANTFSANLNSVNIHHNNITSTFEFKNNNGVACEIDGNSNTLNLDGTIENTIFEAPIVFNVDLSGATVIKSSYSKRVFKRPDSTFKIVHFDNTDTQVINDITD